MKKLTILVLLLCFANQVIQAQGFGSALTSFIVFPEESSLDTKLAPDAQGLIQLDENRIHELHEKIKYNFTRRNYLSYGSFALTGSVFLLGAYQLGFLSYILPESKVAAPNPSSVESRLKFLEDTVKTLSEKVKVQPQISRLQWMLDNAKSITTFATLAVASAKLMQIKNYIEARPTIAYFLNRHNITEPIELLRKTVIAACQPMDDDLHSLDYHRRAVAPMVRSIAAQLEALVAFTEYYFSSQDKEIVLAQAMEDQSRRLFNLSNTFLRLMHEQLQKPVFDPHIVAIVEGFKGDLVMSIKRCTFFEKEFVQQD